MKLKKSFLEKLWPFGKEKDLPPYISYYPGSVDRSDVRRFWDEYKIPLIILLVALIIITIDVLTFAQGSKDSSVRVGDRVPELFIPNVLNSGQRTYNSTDYKDRLLILDFWSTSCGSCINEMPNVAALIKKYDGRVKILEVDYEPAEPVLALYKRRPEIKALGIPVAVGDKRLNILFPHRFQPHIVWIDHGIYKGATEGGYLASGNIDSMLNGSAFVLNQKVDLPPDDRTKPAFVFNSPDKVQPLGPVFGSFFTGHIRGKSPSSGTFTDSLHQVTRFFFYNQSILNMYAYILKSPLPFQANRRILHVRDTSSYYNYKNEYSDRYDEKHTYSFETTLPIGLAREQATVELKSIMESILGIRGWVEKREADVLALVVSGNGPLKSVFPRQDVHDVTGLPIQLHHINVAYLAELMNDTKGIIPIIDETGGTMYFDIDLPSMPASLVEWKKVLKVHGFKLAPGKMNLDFFVLTENGYPNNPGNTPAINISN